MDVLAVPTRKPYYLYAPNQGTTTVNDALDRLKAALADRNEIERELGAGGMATVYLARDLKHEWKVAVKVLRPELSASIGVAHFLREIKIPRVLARTRPRSSHART